MFTRMRLATLVPNDFVGQYESILVTVMSLLNSENLVRKIKVKSKKVVFCKVTHLKLAKLFLVAV